MVEVLGSLTQVIAPTGHKNPPLCICQAHPSVRQVKTSEAAHICGADESVFVYYSSFIFLE